MTNFTPVSGLIGGLLIGLSATIMMLFLGRITGISGILGGVLVPEPEDSPWRLVFLVGLLAGSVGLAFFYPAAFPQSLPRSGGWLIVAGLLVGIGTRMGSGCTSGHGVCGMARFSPRSFVSVAVFVAVGMLTVTVARMLLFGNP